jgi:hypothetical protein
MATFGVLLPPSSTRRRTPSREKCSLDQLSPSRSVSYEHRMPNIAVTKLRRDFLAAISSDQSDVTLDPAIARLRDTISDAGFIEPFSIFSRSQLREIDGALSTISTGRLKNDPLQVAAAVDDILKLFDRLEVTVKRSGGKPQQD